jgi:hypothetical protein
VQRCNVGLARRPQGAGRSSLHVADSRVSVREMLSDALPVPLPTHHGALEAPGARESDWWWVVGGGRCSLLVAHSTTSRPHLSPQRTQRYFPLLTGRRTFVVQCPEHMQGRVGCRTTSSFVRRRTPRFWTLGEMESVRTEGHSSFASETTWLTTVRLISANHSVLHLTLYSCF